MMAGMVEAVLIVVGVMTLLAVGGTAWSLHRLRRRNRVSPRARGAAPLAWLWSWRAPARLHRRLQASVRASSAVASPALAELAAQLERRAVVVDQQLVAAARQPVLLAQVRADVDEIEALCTRLVGLAGQWPYAEGDTAELSQRLDALDQARRELATGG
jgi:hypothetical protein